MAEKIHSTNYSDTFIEVAEDYTAGTAKIPLMKEGKKTVAGLQYELLINRPYELTSDDALFATFAGRNEIGKGELDEARTVFFSKGQPCFRASPLTKSHGFGVHSNHEGKIALYPVGSEAYNAFLDNPEIRKVKAMRNSRK